MSAAIAVMAAGMLTLGTAAALHHLNEGSSVQVNTSDFTWWTQLDVGFDSVVQGNLPFAPIQAQSVSLSALDPSLVASVGNAPKKLPLARIVSLRTSVATHHPVKTHLVSDAASKARASRVSEMIQEPAAVLVSPASIAVSTATASSQDQIQMTSAQPLTSGTASPVVMTEAEKMRAIHKEMRVRFQLAMNTQPLTPSAVPTVFVMTTQNEVVPAVNATPSSTAPGVLPVKFTSDNKNIRQSNKSEKKAPKKSLKSVHAAVVPVPADDNSASRNELPPAQNHLAVVPSTSIQVSTSDAALDAAPDAMMTTQHHLAVVEATAPSSEEAAASETDSIRLAQSHAGLTPVPSKGDSATSAETAESADVKIAAVQTAFAEQPMLSLEMLSQKLTLTAAAPLTTHAVVQLNTASGDYSKAPQGSTETPVNQMTTQSGSSGGNDQAPPPTVPVNPASFTEALVQAACAPESQGVGAFSEGKTWFSISKKVLSQEGNENGIQSKWVLSASQAKKTHWSTLSLEKAKPAHCTPLLAINDVSALSLLAKTTILGDTGIVFGRVPAGWELELRSRSEQPIYFDENLKPIALSADRARYFAFVNVAPGIPLLYLNAHSGGITAAISLPVKPGIATYLELSAPEKKKISGNIYLASSVKARGMTGLSVNVVGQDGKTAITDRAGAFKVSDVLVVGEHPLHIDVTMNDKVFKHRYKIMSDQTQNLSLFHFGGKEVAYWISQLEGGVSPVSGLIVSADRNIKDSEAKRSLPSVVPLLERPTLSSETYTLSPEDHLLVKTPMRTGQSRFISVQVPEGANMPSLITPDGKVIWSQLVVSQPGVINVIDKN
ncbi:MAG: hypothetical protein H7222_14555 [Methylotenera sp.]|nr:hypothetical protein [Oligoflexia bacterium]